MAVPLSPLELLERTWRGETVDADNVRRFVRSWLSDGAPDAQMAAWCAIAQARGLDRQSTLGLMSALIASGERLDLSSIGITGDLHSTGGVGDNVSLVAVPLAAALGVRVAKMSRRGLGHWGGTIDKLEAIPGYRSTIDLGEFIGQVQRVGCALIAQNPRLGARRRAPDLAAGSNRNRRQPRSDRRLGDEQGAGRRSAVARRSR